MKDAFDWVYSQLISHYSYSEFNAGRDSLVMKYDRVHIQVQNIHQQVNLDIALIKPGILQELPLDFERLTKTNLICLSDQNSAFALTVNKWCL